MADYNIIYAAEESKQYLWNGSSFDLLNNDENGKLLFSGKTFEDKELPAELKKCLDVVKHVFPDDNSPQIKPVLIPVNNKSKGAGHSPHMPS